VDQHYIPRGYLRGFCDARTPTGQEPWLWICELRQGLVKRRAPKNVAKRPDYYSVTRDAGEVDHVAERLLSRIESNGIPILSRIREGNFALTDEERQHLALFIGFLITRTPSFRDFMERVAGKGGESIIRVMARHPEYFRRTGREAVGRNMSDEQIEDARLRGLEPERHFIVRGTPDFSLGQALALAPAPAGEILLMQWQFLIAGGLEHFVTGDAPVTWQNSHRAAGLRMRGTRLSFPISPQICLLGTHTEPGGVRDIGADEVRDLNRERVRHADRHIFADSERGAEAARDTYRVLEGAGEAHASPLRLFLMEEGQLRDVSAEIAADRRGGKWTIQPYSTVGVATAHGANMRGVRREGDAVALFRRWALGGPIDLSGVPPPDGAFEALGVGGHVQVQDRPRATTE
jgi:hypothetical protein